MDAAHRLAGYRHRTDELERQATLAGARLAQASGSATSADGAVSVAVSPAGALRQLTLGPPAEEMSRSALAAAILATARRAHAAAAEETAQAMRPLLGERSPAMALLRSQLGADGDRP